MVEHLPWDSQFFERSVGRLTIDTTQRLNVDEIKTACSNYDLLYIYSNKQLNSSIFSPRKNAGVLVDVGGQVKFRKILRKSILDQQLISSATRICPYEGSSASKEIIELAKHAGKMSRFKLDPFLPPKYFEDMYRIWITNSLSNLNVFIYNESVAGLASLDRGGQNPKIGLISVQKELQNRGIGRQLIAYLEQICTKENDQALEVATQMVNKHAIAFYLKNGFVETDKSYLYHWHSSV